MSISINDLLTLPNNKNTEIEQKQFEEKEKEINNKVSLFTLRRLFISFKTTTINL